MTKTMLEQAMDFAAICRKHDLTKYAKHPRQDYVIALADEIERLRGVLRQIQPLVTDQPNRRLIGGCPSCSQPIGSPHLKGCESPP